MSDRSTARTYLLRALAWLATQYKEYHDWRYTCPSCGEKMHNLVPHGTVCLNPKCKRTALGRRPRPPRRSYHDRRRDE